MSLLSVVFRMLSKDGLGFIEPRREDGHGSSAVTPTFVADQTAGAWGYNSGTSGTLNVSAGRRVLQITAVGGASGGSMTLNGGQTITLPALTSIAIEPRGNLTAPTIVFTGTSAYFVEHVG